MAELILASSSPHRLRLLKSINITPDLIISPNIDEARLNKEKADEFVIRLAKTKALKVAEGYKETAYIIAADTIVGTKANIFDKAETKEDVIKYLKFFSGRRIYIKTAVSVVKMENGSLIKQATKLSVNKVKFKRLTEEEIKLYIDFGYGVGTAGGLNIEDFGQVLIKNLDGSYSGTIGLPLYETVNLLKGLGYDCFKSKS